MIQATIKGASEVLKALDKAEKTEQKALETAIKVEGYRLRKTLQQEIRSGAPGGRRFAPLSFLSRAKTGRMRPDKPLTRLAVAIRYFIQQQPFAFHVGWTGPKVSKSWKRIAEKHQAGFTAGLGPNAETQRQIWATYGNKLGKNNSRRKFFFLKKDKTEFTTPARPILEPFWAAHQVEALNNIRRNFARKKAGERI